MKTLVISDMVLLSGNYGQVVDGIEYLKDLQNEGNRLILMTNRPEYCMRIIGGYVTINQSVYYRYLGPSQESGNGIKIKLFNDKKYFDDISLGYDYNIIGNGIRVLDNFDNPIYTGEFLSKEQIASMIDIFEESGYKSFDKLKESTDELGDKCIKSKEDVYKFFTPEIGTSLPSDRVYGMQCSGSCSYYDERLIERVESRNPDIIGYLLNFKPCFYSRKINKLQAFNSAFFHSGLVDINNTRFILTDITDSVFLSEYADLCYVVGDRIDVKNVRKNKCLSKVLSHIECN